MATRALKVHRHGGDRSKAEINRYQRWLSAAIQASQHFVLVIRYRSYPPAHATPYAGVEPMKQAMRTSGRVAQTIVELTSINFSVWSKHCLSGSWVGFSEQNCQRPPKPMSSSISFNMDAESGPLPIRPLAVLDSVRTAANLGSDVSVCRRPWADSSVAEFWQCRIVSSRMFRIGLQL